MKKSNMLILLTMLVVVGCLITYNFKLKAVYDTKSYRKLHNGMEFTPLPGVEKLYLKSNYNTSIEIQQGDKEGVWIDMLIKDQIKFAVNGDRLDVDFKETKGNYYGQSILIIVKNMTDLDVAYDKFKGGGTYFEGRVEVKKCNLSKLNLQLSGNAVILFEDMKVDTLNAVVGQKVGRSVLDLSNKTWIGLANYNIGPEGNLSLSNANLRASNDAEKVKNVVVQN